jgi:hypothetical protein
MKMKYEHTLSLHITETILYVIEEELQSLHLKILRMRKHGSQ